MTERPTWLTQKQEPNTDPGILDVDGTQYFFTLVRAGIAPRLPYAVGFPAPEALFVSVDAQESDRLHLMRHEVREKTRFTDLPEEERCRASLQEELKDVLTQTPEGYAGYLARRTAFFDALVTFYKQPEQAAAVTPGFIQGIHLSQEYLHTIVPTTGKIVRG